jgi:hypothetical protein
MTKTYMLAKAFEDLVAGIYRANGFAVLKPTGGRLAATDSD